MPKYCKAVVNPITGKAILSFGKTAEKLSKMEGPKFAEVRRNYNHYAKKARRAKKKKKKPKRSSGTYSIPSDASWVNRPEYDQPPGRQVRPWKNPGVIKIKVSPYRGRRKAPTAAEFRAAVARWKVKNPKFKYPYGFKSSTEDKVRRWRAFGEPEWRIRNEPAYLAYYSKYGKKL